MRWPENQQGSRVTCRDDVLAAMHALVQRHGRDVFKLEDIVLEVESRGTSAKESTIRTHIVSAMCVNAPANHAVRYPDLIRVDRAMYRLAN